MIKAKLRRRKKRKGILGSIYSDQRCPDCGGSFYYNGKDGLYCFNHEEQRATGQFKVMFKGLCLRFDTFSEAQKKLIRLNSLLQEEKFDAREYQKGKPLAFATIADQWLERRKKEVRCFRNLRDHIEKAKEFYRGNSNIKEIKYLDDLDDMLASSISEKTKKPLSEKSRKNVFTTLHAFWEWFEERERRRDNDKYRMPLFPKIYHKKVKLGQRKVTTIERQEAVIEEVKRITPHNPKIWLGIDMLRFYIGIRPIELLHVKEADIDHTSGLMTIRHTKVDDTYPVIALIPEHIEVIRSLPRGMPSMYFFRHEKRKGAQPDSRFGKDHFWKWWKEACANLGIKGIDLYGGTRHTSARALRKKGRTPEEIKRVMFHRTTEAFNRYLVLDEEEQRSVYQDIRSDKVLIRNIEQK